MNTARNVKLFVSLLVFLFVLSVMTYSQNKYDFFKDQNESEYSDDVLEDESSQEGTVVDATRNNKKDKCYTISPFYWPKIMVFGTASAVAVYVAIVYGLISIVTGWNAGGKLNKTKIYITIFLTTVVGILGRSLIIYIQQFLNNYIVKLVFKDETIAGTISETIIYILWTAFLSAVAIFLYETFIVTAKEAHPMG